MHLKMKLM